MKVIGMCVCHYGSDYLGSAIEALYPLMDEIVIVYTPQPSFGYAPSGIVCPDNKDELVIQAFLHDTENKVEWVEGVFKNQSEHRQFGFDCCKSKGADIMVVFDTDEVFILQELHSQIEEAYKNQHSTRIKMVHFYRSFNEYCSDWQRQDRIYNVHAPTKWNVSDTLSCYHFGYAKTEEMVRFKCAIHGDQSEFRKDLDWYNEKFLNYQKGVTKDLHPVIKDMWNAEPFDKTMLPSFMRQHKYYNLEKIV